MCLRRPVLNPQRCCARRHLAQAGDHTCETDQQTMLWGRGSGQRIHQLIDSCSLQQTRSLAPWSTVPPTQFRSSARSRAGIASSGVARESYRATARSHRLLSLNASRPIADNMAGFDFSGTALDPSTATFCAGVRRLAKSLTLLVPPAPSNHEPAGVWKTCPALFSMVECWQWGISEISCQQETTPSSGRWCCPRWFQVSLRLRFQ